jgi:sulfate permease, SulP family
MNGYSLPFLRGVLPIDTNKLAGDIVAGVTLAALGIPEVMGYTKIAGTPIVTGLYTLLLPVIAFALLGGSSHLVVAADSATAAILASVLVGIAVLGSPRVCRRNQPCGAGSCGDVGISEGI